MNKCLPHSSWVWTCAFALFSSSAVASISLQAIFTDSVPSIDGIANDPAWQMAPATEIKDTVANIPITLKAAYNDKEIFILASYPDHDINLLHKYYHWNADLEAYLPGPEREDTLVLKWSMVSDPGDLTLSSAKPYEADIWFWKAHRTDPAGYADDKVQMYTQVPSAKSKRLINKNGELFFLTRTGDEGQSSYFIKHYDGYTGDKVSQFGHRSPKSSRGDVQAKGSWQDGQWTIEFRRKLNTHHTDDLAFEAGKRYLFGVSRYEIAGRKRDPKLEQPLYGSGDIGPLMELHFAR